AAPMQCAEVAQAAPIEYDRPLILNAVARLADTVEHIVRGTMYGPTLRTPRSRSRSAAATCQWLEPPPEPAIRPVRGALTAASSRPAPAMASRLDTQP